MRPGLSKANPLTSVPYFFTQTPQIPFLCPLKVHQSVLRLIDPSSFAPALPLHYVSTYESEHPLSISFTQPQDPVPRLTFLKASSHSDWGIWTEGCLYIKGSGSGLGHETIGWHLPGSSPRLAFQQLVPSLCACPCSHLQGVGVSHLHDEASGLRRSRFLFSSSFLTLSVSLSPLGELVVRVKRGDKGTCLLNDDSRPLPSSLSDILTKWI